MKRLSSFMLLMAGRNIS